MESQNLMTIATALRTQRDVASEKAVSLKAELASIEEEVARIEAALTALSGEFPKATNNSSKLKQPRRAPQGRAAKKADVIAAMRRVLDKEHVMQPDILKNRVEALLVEDGFNRFGFAMRWTEAAQDPQFVIASDGLKVRDNTMTQSKESSNKTVDRRQSNSTPEAP